MKRSLKIQIVIASSVAVATFMVFLPSLQNEFISWDDNRYVYDNPLIRSLDIHLWTSAFSGFHVENYHPLTWLSHALDYAIWGLNPLGHHLTNNILHTFNTFLVVFLVMRILEVFKKTAEHDKHSQLFLNDRTIWITSAVTGLLFGLHPVHVEAVAWVSDRKELLCTFFYLLTIYTYTNYVGEITTSTSTNAVSRLFSKQYLLTLGLFILSLLSKPMAVSLPFVLLILDWCLFRRIRSLNTCLGVVIEKLPFIILSLLLSTLTILAQKAGGAMELMQHVPLPIRLLVAVRSLMAYLGKMILPLNLVPVYPYPRSVSLFSLGSIIPIVTVIAITATCMAIARNQKMWMAVWSYYVITLLPVLGIVQAGAQSMGDRFTYLPSIGPFLIIGLTASKLYEKTTDLKKWKSIAKIAGLFMALAILVSMSYATIKQLGIWRNSIIFWNYIIAKEPVSDPFAYNNLGAAYASKGELSMAIDQYQTALRLYPVYAAAHYNLGIVYEAKGLIDLATEQYETALRLKPSLLGAHINLGNIYFSHDLFDMAIQQYQAALQLDPNYVDAYNNLGLSYASKGQLGMAIQQYQAALRLDPDYAEAHFNLGRIYLNSGIMDMARREYELGLKNKPDDYEAKQILNSLKAQ